MGSMLKQTLSWTGTRGMVTRGGLALILGHKCLCWNWAVERHRVADFLEAMSARASRTIFGLHNWNPDGSETQTPATQLGSRGACVCRLLAASHRRFPLCYRRKRQPTQGYAEWFFDGQEIGNTITFGQTGLLQRAEYGTHPKIVVGSGSGTTRWAVYDVEVWQYWVRPNLRRRRPLQLSLRRRSLPAVAPTAWCCRSAKTLLSTAPSDAAGDATFTVSIDGKTAGWRHLDSAGFAFSRRPAELSDV